MASREHCNFTLITASPKKINPVCQGHSQTIALSDIRGHLTASTAGSACWQDVFNKWWSDARSDAFFCTRIRGGRWPGTSVCGSHHEMLSFTVGVTIQTQPFFWATCGWGQNMVYHGRAWQKGSQRRLMQNMQCWNWRSHRVKSRNDERLYTSSRHFSCLRNCCV